MARPPPLTAWLRAWWPAAGYLVAFAAVLVAPSWGTHALVAGVCLATALLRPEAALPALVEFQAQAEQTALASLAAAAGSAMVLNQAGCLVTQQRPVPGKCEAIDDCRQVQRLLLVDLPAGYHVMAQPLAADGLARGGDTCRLLRERDGASAGFYGVAAGH